MSRGIGAEVGVGEGITNLRISENSIWKTTIL